MQFILDVMQHLAPGEVLYRALQGPTLVGSVPPHVCVDFDWPPVPVPQFAVLSWGKRDMPKAHNQAN